MQQNEKIRNRRILVVDDNKAIHEDFRKILGGTNELVDEISDLEKSIFGSSSISSVSSDFEIDSAYQGEDALEMVRMSYETDRPYSLAFIDIRMPPGWDGIETISKIWSGFPDIQIIICTAYSDYSWLEILEKFGDTEKLLILKKPFDSIEVRQMAITMTEKWSLTREKQRYIDSLQSLINERANCIEQVNSQLDQVLKIAQAKSGDPHVVDQIREKVELLIKDNNDKLEMIRNTVANKHQD